MTSFDEDVAPKEVIVIYICGPQNENRATIAGEIVRNLNTQGLKANILDGNEMNEDALNRISDPGALETHAKQMRRVKDLEIPIGIRRAEFKEERIQEMLNRDADSTSPPAVLCRICWGTNILTEKIVPGKWYLVRINNLWYTGTFKLGNRQDVWEFEESEKRLIEGVRRYTLTREAGGSGIQEIYEIVQGGPEASGWHPNGKYIGQV